MMNIQLYDDEEIELGCEEIWSFCLQGLWLLLERKKRMILAACLGDRSIETAKNYLVETSKILY